MLKSWFGKINNFLALTHFNHAELEIPEKLVTNPVLKDNRYLVMNSFTTNFLNFYHNPYKLKLFLTKINNGLIIANTFPKEYSPRIYYYTLLISFLGFGIAFVYAKVKKKIQ
jgi:hypothetical protein